LFVRELLPTSSNDTELNKQLPEAFDLNNFKLKDSIQNMAKHKVLCKPNQPTSKPQTETPF
jgi:hypothetical protein